MEIGLSARDRRTLLVGVSVVGALFTLGRGVPALMQWQRSTRAEATSVISDLRAAQAGARLMPVLRDSLRSRQARLVSLDSGILRGPTSSAAAAGLASKLEELADDASVKVSAMQLQADSTGAGALFQVGVRMTSVGDIYGLLALLRAIEAGTTLLSVRDLAVTQPDPMAPTSKPETLRLDIMVVGLARIGAETR
jgi:type II secretion system (T2SS) protein M